MSAAPSSPGKLVSLKALHHWAFPHVWLWVSALCMFSINAIWIGLSTRIAILPMWYFSNLGFAGIALLLALARGWREESFDWLLHRVWCLFMGALFASVLLNNLMVLNHLLMTINFPMADARLLAWDSALGFDWLSYSKAMTHFHPVQKTLSIAYQSMTYAGVGFIAAILICMNRRKRIIELAYLLTAAAFFCLIVAIGFPAHGTMALLADNELLARLEFGAGTFFIDQLDVTRSSAPLLLIPDQLQGLASFPSFHTCLGMIIMRCSRGHWFTGLTGKIIGVLIIAATPIYGGHYFVDLVSGAGLMALAIWFWQAKIASNVEETIPGIHKAALAMPQLRTRI
jgi:hypothetical protein